MCINEALQLHPDGHVHVILHPQVDVSIENPTCTCICMGLDINFMIMLGNRTTDACSVYSACDVRHY